MNIEQMAEIKGYLCGFICSGAQSEGKTWLEVLEGGLHGMDISNQRGVLIDLYKQVSEDFLQDDPGITHAIFEKTLPLYTRAQIFKTWCHGFSAGIRQSGLPERSLPQAPENIKEKMAYFEGISTLDFANIEVSEADEMMFDEVMQFLERTVLQIYRTLHQNTPKH